MRLFKSDWVDWVLTTLKVPDDVPIENKRVTGAIASAQSQVEAQNFDSRKNVLKYDDVMSRQREVIYAERRAVLEGADLHEQVRSMIDEVVDGYVTGATEGFPEEWDLEALWTALKTLYPLSLKLADLENEAGGRDGLTRELLLEDIKADAHAAYDARETTFGPEVMRELERRVVLSVLDRKWREHLYEMDYLREGIGLRAYSQRDPLVEYQREGFDMFAAMMEGIKEESVGYLFNLEVQLEEEPEAPELTAADLGPGTEATAGPAVGPVAGAAAAAAALGAATAPSSAPSDGTEQFGAAVAQAAAASTPHIVAPGLTPPKPPSALSYSAPDEGGDVEVTSAVAQAEDAPGFDAVGRNALCPCGSGKKYKKCHGAPGGPTGLTTRVNG
jgi:preprotein translocase subunit SecA